ncbi:nitroreductase family protein [Saccharopolyspora sp. NPDC000359]|uniref:nitroreductase family protein n=1 Tax=Saccharopolyspora sp. NPDC000359 TaxID=3154251 RepID=UPI0033345636
MSVRKSLHQAWHGEPPGETDHALRPAECRSWPGPEFVLGRWPRGGLGALLDLALASSPRRAGGVRLRRVPSAGGRYPVEAHVVHRGTAWRYDPVRHSLVAPTTSALSTSDLRVVLSVNPYRTWWRYGPRSLPVLLLDLGHAVGALLAAAAALDHPARATTGLGADVLAEWAGLPRAGAAWPGCAPEFPLAVVEIDAALPVPLATPDEHAPEPDFAAAPGKSWNQLIAALTELGTGTRERVWQWGAPAPAVPDLLARTTAPWEAVTSGSAGPAELLRAAAPLSVGQVAMLRPARSELVADLAPRSCGQPQLARAGALLLATGTVDPDPATAFDEHLGAGLAVHAAWLAATELGLAARPVGCWIDTVLRAAAGPARLLHALAVGGA